MVSKPFLFSVDCTVYMDSKVLAFQFFLSSDTFFFFFLHGTEMFYPIACLWSKMPMLQIWNEEGRGATPTSISTFDSYDMKTI